MIQDGSCSFVLCAKFMFIDEFVNLDVRIKVTAESKVTQYEQVTSRTRTIGPGGRYRILHERRTKRSFSKLAPTINCL